MIYIPRKNEEVIGYTDTLWRVNGEPARGKVTRVAERSNEGLTMNAWRRLQWSNAAHAASATRRGRGAGFRATTLSALNDLTEIPTLREVLCSPKIQREEPESGRPSGMGMSVE